MLGNLFEDTDHIYIACGYTDFRKQIEGLVQIVNAKLKLDPFASSTAFIFCNKRRTSIKVLRFDKNGFILATKKLLDGMKFEWPRNVSEVKDITNQQVKWLLYMKVN